MAAEAINQYIQIHMKNSLLIFFFLCLAACADGRARHPFQELQKMRKNIYLNDHLVSTQASLVHVAPQDCKKDADKIINLPGQPKVNFSQYSGYVTVDPKAGRSLFYYFAEGADPASKPLVLWLNGGPGCSSLSNGALSELGPFRVNPDGKTLKYNPHAWNRVANIIFLESPAGVGFSYSNTSSDYVTGDTQTAADSYTFLINWLERFPEYKNRDFFLAGESYAGHYIPQLADLILEHNKKKKHTVIKLKGFTMGNAYTDFTDRFDGTFDYWWTHALISDETHQAIINNCDFSSSDNFSEDCINSVRIANHEIGKINIYNIYGPLCGSKASAQSISSFDPCTDNYVYTYLNTPEVQEALHANITKSLPGPWQDCSDPISQNWTDNPMTVLPLIKKLMASGNIRVLIYSGDIDGIIPVTTTKYSMAKLKVAVRTPWYPWYEEGEVGGYAVEYDQNVTFATVRAAGHMVPSDQPGRGLTLFTSFLKGKLPPRKRRNTPELLH